MSVLEETTQQNQPEGVPPLSLTGERTLPDVPAENYWYRRHLVVYRWIAERCAGLDVVDMACGEGYGTDVLAGRAARVTGVDANPEAHEHARLKYARPGVRFVRDLVESYDEPCDAVVFLQTIEHVQDPEAVLEHLRGMLRPGGAAYVSTPNLLTLAPPGAEKSDNPWHVKEYRAGEFRALCERVFPDVELLGVFHSRMLRARVVGRGAAHLRRERRLARVVEAGGVLAMDRRAHVAEEAEVAVARVAAHHRQLVAQNRSEPERDRRASEQVEQRQVDACDRLPEPLFAEGPSAEALDVGHVRVEDEREAALLRTAAQGRSTATKSSARSSGPGRSAKSRAEMAGVKRS